VLSSQVQGLGEVRLCLGVAMEVLIAKPYRIVRRNLGPFGPGWVAERVHQIANAGRVLTKKIIPIPQVTEVFADFGNMLVPNLLKGQLGSQQPAKSFIELFPVIFVATPVMPVGGQHNGYRALFQIRLSRYQHGRGFARCSDQRMPEEDFMELGSPEQSVVILVAGKGGQPVKLSEDAGGVVGFQIRRVVNGKVRGLLPQAEDTLVGTEPKQRIDLSLGSLCQHQPASQQRTDQPEGGLETPCLSNGLTAASVTGKIHGPIFSREPAVHGVSFIERSDEAESRRKAW
jgi:hypothetical protein